MIMFSIFTLPGFYNFKGGNVLVSSDMSGVICLWRLSETGQMCPVIRWVPSEMSELTGVIVDIDVVSTIFLYFVPGLRIFKKH